MKKLGVVILMSMILLLMISCGENMENTTSRLDELIASYDPVGFGHNEELDHMLAIFNAQKSELTKEKCRVMLDEYFDNAGNFAREIDKLIGDPYDLAKTTANSDVIDLLADTIEIYSKYPDIFQSMTDILDAQLTTDDKIEKLQLIYLAIDDKATDVDDRESLMNGLSTTIHSLQYWDENYDEWQNCLGEDLGKKTLGIAGAIGIVDGAGAVIGTLEGIRDTYKGQEGRVRIIVGRAIGEAAKTSAYVVMSILLL